MVEERSDKTGVAWNGWLGLWLDQINEIATRVLK